MESFSRFIPPTFTPEAPLNPGGVSQFALKIVKCGEAKDCVDTVLESHKLALAFARNRYFCRIYEILYTKETTEDEEFANVIYSLMDYYPEGNLATYILSVKSAPIPEERILQWMEDLATGVEILHSHSPPIVHRAIHPENLILDGKGGSRLRIAGFGRAVCHGPNSHGKFMHTLRAGDLTYRAPEQEESDSYKSPVDVWALGGILYELITRFRPILAGCTLERRLEQNPVHKTYSSGLIDLLKALLKLDPKERPTATEAKKAFQALRKAQQEQNVEDKRKPAPPEDLTIQPAQHSPVAVLLIEASMSSSSSSSSPSSSSFSSSSSSSFSQSSSTTELRPLITSGSVAVAVCLIFLRGTVGSGKTTFAEALKDELEKDGYAVLLEGVDKYSDNQGKAKRTIKGNLKQFLKRKAKSEAPKPGWIVIIDTCGEVCNASNVFGVNFKDARTIEVWPNLRRTSLSGYLLWSLRNVLNRDPRGEKSNYSLTPSNSGFKVCCDVWGRKNASLFPGAEIDSKTVPQTAEEAEEQIPEFANEYAKLVPDIDSQVQRTLKTIQTHKTRDILRLDNWDK